jgi:MFS family permease
MISETKRKLLVVGFVVTLLYSLHFAIPLYVNSIMLGTMFSKAGVSIIIMLAAISALFVTTHLGQTIKKYHNYKTTLMLLFVSIVSTAMIGLVNIPLLVALFYILHFSCVAALFIMVNLYIEEFTDVDEEGATRGMFLTLLNTGILVAPLVAGGIVNTSGFMGVYIISSLCLIPVIFLMRRFYAHVHEPKYLNINYKVAIREALMNKNIYGALVALLALESFYVLMSVYSGIYIVETIGIPLPVYLGVIMPFALIPFVILPYGLGKLADIRTGEKEMMVVGLTMIGLSTIFISFVTSQNPLTWAVVLFIARFGSAMLEAMIFSYFFKRVDRSDVGLVALFGSIRTLAFIFVPLIGSLVFIFIDGLQTIFIFGGIAVLFAIIPVLKIRDTL